ncbi:Small-conductance mechanosensitive channel [Methanimicrococcus sp. At1]|uniref:Small-conductance mechanosensitive channel n=1 Tax=Methanimicrococcus hacksteinii TaxID=3028293 RepID=A0ABU3VRP8_9EURY|nr:mechanosensitive ion channel family protein [Methanimicrococcus sp. At1]MDV0446066.1 Small-conductance mechanosensitive channel [Methanimicrococcus sp. At1]
MGTAIPYTQWQVSDLLFALIILVAAFIVARILISIFKKLLGRTKIPELAASFLIQLITALLYVAVLLATLSALGVTVSSVILGLSAVIGLILGFGMQDTLTNLGAGVWLAVLEPFNKNDYITVSGQTGYVKDVGLMSTELITSDNVYIMIPNKMVWNSAIVNMSHLPTRRFVLPMTFNLIENAEGTVKAVLDVLGKDPEILQNPEPKIYISNITDATVDLEIRAWVNTKDADTIKESVKEELLKEFEV